jgi:hypothetical protein
MKVARNLNYAPALPYHARVQLLRKDDPRAGHFGVVVAALPNPSQRPENQWYDVRFDDETYGRFPARDLTPIR